jgi:WD40 repeat protein
MWNPATGQLIAELTAPGSEHMAQVTCTELDGRPLAVAACNGGALLLWDLSERALIGQPMGGGTGGVGSVVCTDLDGRRVALTGDLNGIVRIWDLATRTLLATAVTPSASTASRSGDVAGWTVIMELPGHNARSRPSRRWVRSWSRQPWTVRGCGIWTRDPASSHCRAPKR